MTAPVQPADSSGLRWTDRLTMGLLSIMVTAFTMIGQVVAARRLGVPAEYAWLTPAAFELSMVGFMVHGYRRGRRNRSPAPMWAIAAAIGGAAIYVQLIFHDPFAVGVLFAMGSAVCLVLWFAKLYDAYRDHLAAQGKVVTPIPKFGRNWVLAPRHAWRAMLIATKIHSENVEQTLRLALVWRVSFRSARLQNVPAHLARMAAWNAVYESVGLPVVNLGRVVIQRATVTEADRVTEGPDRVTDRVTAPRNTRVSRGASTRSSTASPRAASTRSRAGQDAARDGWWNASRAAFYAVYAQRLDDRGEEVGGEELAGGVGIADLGNARTARGKYLRTRYADEVARGTRQPRDGVVLPTALQTLITKNLARGMTGELRQIGTPQ